jgi:hypothetical protein
MRPAVALLLAVLATAGCGRAADRDEVRSVTEHFLGAVEAGDGELACGDLSTDTRKALESQEQRDCRDAVGELQLEPGATERVEVYVTNAKVDLASGQSVFLSRTQEGWRLSAVGCEPEAGEPAEQPFDCEVEA